MAWPDSGTQIWVFLYHANTQEPFSETKIWDRVCLRNIESLFKKYSKFQNFDEIIYCGMTSLTNTNLYVFLQYQYTRAVLRNKNMGQSLKIQNSKNGMTRFRNFKLGVFRQNQNTKTILKKTTMAQNSKFPKFQLSNFTFTWWNEGIMKGVWLDMTKSVELQQKVKMLDKFILRNILITQI